MKNDPKNWKKNTFKYEPIDFRRKHIWMHQLEKQERNHIKAEIYSTLISFFIIVVFLSLATLLIL